MEPEFKATFNEKGEVVLKKKSKIKMGRVSRASGARFELKVREDLENKGWVVSKWSNNVDNEKLIPAKRKFNPFSKVLTIGTGFPDFIAVKHLHDESYSVIGVEVKTNGTLSKIEKEKCVWYLKNKIFSRIWIAKTERVGRKIEVKYDDFIERYGKSLDKQKDL